MKKTALSILMLLLFCSLITAQDMGADDMNLSVEEFIAAAESLSLEELQMSIAIYQMMGGMEGLLTMSPEYAELTPEEKAEFDEVKDVLVLYMDSHFNLLLFYKQGDYQGMKALAQESRNATDDLKKKPGLDEEARDMLDTMSGYYGDLIKLADSKR